MMILSADVDYIEDQFAGTLYFDGCDVVFYGPTPEHVVGMFHRYLASRTSLYTVDISYDTVSAVALTPLP